MAQGIPLERRTGNMDISSSINNNFDWGNIWDSALGSSHSDGKGGVVKNGGFVSPVISAFNAWNSWDQGNKMYDLQSEAFDFSKDKFWNNYLTNKDITNRQIGSTNRQIDYNRNTSGMNAAEKQAYFQNQSTDYYKGDRIKEVDGSYSTVGQAAPAKYTGTSQFGTPTTSTPATAPAQAPTAPTKVAAASQPASLAAKSKFVGEKPKKLT